METYAKCLEHSYLADGEMTTLTAEEASLKILLYGSHCADLARIWKPQQIAAKTIHDLMKRVDDQNNDDARHDVLLIFNESAQLCKTMGDSIGTEYDVDKKQCIPPQNVRFCNLYQTAFPKTNIDEFYNYSTDVQLCIDMINKNEAYLSKCVKEITAMQHKLISLTKN
jgi:hypothetical protein